MTTTVQRIEYKAFPFGIEQLDHGRQHGDDLQAFVFLYSATEPYAIPIDSDVSTTIVG